MASDYTHGVETAKNDDGSPVEETFIVGFLELRPDGHTLVDIRDGSKYDLSNIGSGGSDADTHVPISEDGTEKVADPGDLNFGSGITAAADGDGTATVSVADDTVRTRQAEIVPTTISDASSAPGLWLHVPSGKTLKILEAGVQDSTQSAPTGLTIEVYDNTNATTIMSKNALHVEGSPIASKSGAIDVVFRVANATGGSVDASGYVLYTME